MRFIKQHGHLALSVFIAFVFIQSLFFKFTDSPETTYIFVGKLDDWDSMKAGVPAGLPGASYALSPPEVLARYERWDSICVRTAPLQNAAYRRKLKLPDNDLGVRVDSVLPGTPAEKILRADDVILQVGKYPVGSDGTIIYEGNRMALAMAIQEAQHGQSVAMKLWRAGKEESVALPVEVSVRPLALRVLTEGPAPAP